MIKIYKQYKAIILYLFWGVMTTIVNIVSFYINAHILNCNTVVSTWIAWILSVLFAYITNKLWVFESKDFSTKMVLKEILSFFSCRLLTGFLDVVIMYVFVDVLYYSDVVMKIVSNVLIVILNYIASKWFIFKKIQ